MLTILPYTYFFSVCISFIMEAQLASNAVSGVWHCDLTVLYGTQYSPRKCSHCLSTNVITVLLTIFPYSLCCTFHYHDICIVWGKCQIVEEGGDRG